MKFLQIHSRFRQDLSFRKFTIQYFFSRILSWILYNLNRTYTSYADNLALFTQIPEDYKSELTKNDLQKCCGDVRITTNQKYRSIIIRPRKMSRNIHDTSLCESRGPLSRSNARVNKVVISVTWFQLANFSHIILHETHTHTYTGVHSQVANGRSHPIDSSFV